MLDPSEVPLSEACHLYSVCGVPPPCSLPSAHPQISGARIPGWQACSSSLSLFSHHLREADGKEKPAEQLHSRPQCLGATFSWDIHPQALGLLTQKMLRECLAHRKAISTICENMLHGVSALLLSFKRSFRAQHSSRTRTECALMWGAVKLLWLFQGKWVM